MGKAKAEKSASTEDNFIGLMMVAAEFAKQFGGIDQAKKALEETGKFIEKAGSVASASKALEVLENLKSRI
jgi:hypothetical protein